MRRRWPTALTLLALFATSGIACGRCPDGGCGSGQIVFEVVGSPRPDWHAAVAPCLQDSWDWRVEVVATPPAKAGARITIPAERYRASANPDPAVYTCLRALDGVTAVHVPRRA